MTLFKDLRKYSILIALCSLPFTHTLAATCGDAETFKTLREQGDYRGALQELDKCISAAGDKKVATDLTLLNELMKQILRSADTSSFDEVYRNFQSVLKIHLLSKLEVEFADFFKTHPKEDAKLFTELRKADEKYYFYYDTGRMLSHSRGLALTDKALLWKNLTGVSVRLPFDDIKSMSLIYELGLSLTGWKLRINNSESYDIRLSGVPTEVIQPFITAIIYFINANKTVPQKEIVALEVPEREIAILAGWVTLCSDKQQDQGDAIKNLQLLDACLVNYGKEFKLSHTDKELVNQFTTATFQQKPATFDEGYTNFKVVLSTHFFSHLNFKFKENISKELETKLFKEKRETGEIYHFYFDTGRVASGSRGIALTDKSIIWKNLISSSLSWKSLTGEINQMPLKNISQITLIHELGLSTITGWKIRLNGSEINDIVLSQLSEDNVELFANALVYYINMVTGGQLALQVPQETRDVLTKTFLERHPQIKSVTDSIFSAIMPKKAEEATPAEPAKQAEEATPAKPATTEEPSTAPESSMPGTEDKASVWKELPKAPGMDGKAVTDEKKDEAKANQSPSVEPKPEMGGMDKSTATEKKDEEASQPSTEPVAKPSET
jgi:hypothetical protein